MREWISVEDRLPEDGIEVLAYTIAHSVRVLKRNNLMDDWDVTDRKNACIRSDYVTHWMPLPEPPEVADDVRGTN